jgi:hypothetical protein
MKIGTQIYFVPKHVSENEITTHKDVKKGFVSKLTDDPNYVFCRFWLKGEDEIDKDLPVDDLLDKLRTRSCGERCHVSYLKLISEDLKLDKYIIDKVLLGLHIEYKMSLEK